MPFQALFVPAGYVLAQRSGDMVLIYGARKSFCMGGAVSSAAFKPVVDFMADTKKSSGPSRYEEVLNAMANADAPFTP